MHTHIAGLSEPGYPQLRAPTLRLHAAGGSDQLHRLDGRIDRRVAVLRTAKRDPEHVRLGGMLDETLTASLPPQPMREPVHWLLD